MEVVAPASLQTAVNQATPGETIALAGVFRENVKIGKAGVKLVPKDNAPAVIIGRMWVTGADVTVRNLLLDGRNSSNLPSPTIDAARAHFHHNEVTNANTAIAFNTTAYAGAQPDDVLIEHNWIHHVGVMPPKNHDHGVYVAAGRRARVRHNLIHDCSDRGIQVYSYAYAHDALVEYNLVAFCGQGIEVGGGEAGEPSARALIRKNIIAFMQGGPGGLYTLMTYWHNNATPGVGNVADDNIIWSPPNHPTHEVGLTVTRTKNVDPLFVNATARDFRLRQGSPAIGYGPASIQPGSPSVDRATILAQARAHMAKTTITYKTWLARKQAGYYRDPSATEWAKADALLDKLK